MKSFINDREIWETIDKSKRTDAMQVRDILQKAITCAGLDIYETSLLLHVNDRDLLAEIFGVAKRVKEIIYGNRIVLFIPLYISNECSNICSYCAFRADNLELQRKTLSFDEIREEVIEIERSGHKRILCVFGENVNYPVEDMAKCVQTIYETKSPPSGDIRRVNINAAPMSISDFRIIADSQIGTYQCFQETYHQKTYEQVHIAGTKSDFLWRLYSLHRAQEAGIDDVASGVLYGLFDPYFDTLAMLQHALELEKVFGVGPHTISFPRIEPAFGSKFSEKPPYLVDDDLFKKIVTVLRLAIPYTGMILSTRESAELRSELIDLGISQISAGSKTSPGSYHESGFADNASQFKVADERNLDDVIYELTQTNHIPSFCTACYRSGRHGQCFMDMAKNTHIKKYCQPNAILTFAEYLEDYASEKTRSAGYGMINPQIDETLSNELEEIKNGKRDVYH
jgi:2-iminoacetate synthase